MSLGNNDRPCGGADGALHHYLGATTEDNVHLNRHHYAFGLCDNEEINDPY
jgi:hypothetical protein